jgi:uncharacterized Zn finger protein
MWTETQILQLAPDAPTANKGRTLASMGKWLTLRTDGNALWGECKGSGKLPYFVQIDLLNPAFKCSCPARKFPCKHSIALGLLFTQGSDGFMMEEQPETVENWIASRTKRLEKKEEKVDVNLEKEIAEKVQAAAEQKAKTLDSRIQNIQDGLPELETWLLDITREGIASIEKNAVQICEDIAVRMSDAKMKGMATRIREIPVMINASPNWMEKVTTRLGELYLFINAFRQYENLPENLQEELKQTAGINIKKEEIRIDIGVEDEWLILGKSEGQDEINPRIFFRKIWLWAVKNKRPAMILDYNFGSASFPNTYILGTQFKGELAFYPGTFQLRALVKTQQQSNGIIEFFPGYDNFKAFLLAYANAIAENPWLRSFPCVLSNVRPMIENEKLMVADKNAELVKIQSDKNNVMGWKLIALSGGKEIDVFGEWTGESLVPLSACVEGKFVNLAT